MTTRYLPLIDLLTDLKYLTCLKHREIILKHFMKIFKPKIHADIGSNLDVHFSD